MYRLGCDDRWPQKRLRLLILLAVLVLDGISCASQALPSTSPVVPAADTDHESQACTMSLVRNIATANGVMRISLRDFRPHVGLLVAAGHSDLATHIAQDYLDAYARGLNDFIRDLRRIVSASRETRLLKLEWTDE